MADAAAAAAPEPAAPRRLTAFGTLEHGWNVAAAQGAAETLDALSLLYPPTKFTDAEIKKMDKARKFREKELAKKAKSKDKTPSKRQLAKQQKEKEKQAAAANAAGDANAYKSVKPGQKPDVVRPLSAAYDPLEVEDGWYDWWKQEGFFTPEYVEKQLPPGAKPEHFTIVIPPPNVTGTLHLGHALTNAIEDSIVRWNRMNGKVTLWNPGCDHAGIATQTVVEKKLTRDRGLSRHDLGREAFLEEVWKWKHQSGGRIYQQLEGLGASLDWDREAFTMSDRCNKAVEAAFIKMHRDGVIYRKKRLINWSCQLQSAIADIEVDKEPIKGRTLMKVPGYDQPVEVGMLSSFAYKVDGCDDEIVVATTRLETMLGDSAVAVHPDDARYTKLVGKTLTHPLIPNRKLVIVADTMVDIAFGTGAVKITPAHDPNDWECGKRHDLPFVTVIDQTGLISPGCGEFSGMKRYDARVAVEKKLTALGLFRGKKDNPMVVPICSRSKDIIEPLAIPQWFCDCTDMAAKAVDAVREGRLKIVPEHHKKIWYNWLENIREWCISRQLWWGHRIPAYFITIEGGPVGSDEEDKFWVSASTEAEAKKMAAERFGVDPKVISLRRDEDVLDTWFSSGIFPISIFGWPDKTPDFNKFYPGHLLETGYDILFFWVARMVMMCEYFTGQLPFTTVYLHSLVRDAHGRKMSKSLGNVVDPMDVRNGVTLGQLQKTLENGNLPPKEVKKAKQGQAEDYPDGIPQCGVDALRFGLCNFLSLSGTDINLNVNKVHRYRMFCNKMWQATKFGLSKLSAGFKPAAELGSNFTPDKWILSRLACAVEDTNAGFEEYDFGKATTAVYNFWLHEFCDVYIEWVKPAMVEGADPKARAATENVICTCLDVGLRLISPFMPYVSEELWQRIPKTADAAKIPSICVAPYPATAQWAATRDDAVEAKVGPIIKVILSCRSTKAGYGIADNVKPEVYFKVGAPGLKATIQDLQPQIDALARIKGTVLDGDIPEGCAQEACEGAEIYTMVKGYVDVEKQIEKLEASINYFEGKIAKDTALLESVHAQNMDANKLEAKKKGLEEANAELAAKTATLERYRTL
mmetsp:Transcript_11473/g.29318  ORF Transcript_11473/g.29318 Transcript_11473/m.29318 type:complete len:1087 (+) Transcript_11473:104-3364(+)